MAVTPLRLATLCCAMASPMVLPLDRRLSLTRTWSGVSPMISKLSPSDPDTYYGGGAAGYVDYPTALDKSARDRPQTTFSSSGSGEYFRVGRCPMVLA